jgi:hypothetical protein
MITNHHRRHYYLNVEQMLKVMLHRHWSNNVDMLNFSRAIDRYIMDEIHVHHHMVIVEVVHLVENQLNKYHI